VIRLFPPAHGQRDRRIAAGTAALALVIAVAALFRQFVALAPPQLYHKDLVQEYLMARAVLDRQDPYAPVPALAARYMADVYPLPEGQRFSVISTDWPSVHPPFVALLTLPLGLFPFPVAATLWLGYDLLLLFILAWLVLACGPRAPGRASVLVTAGLLLFWLPVFHELLHGQLSLTLSCLLLLGWRAYRSGRLGAAGALLGAAAAVKLFPIVIVGYFLVKREWRVAVWAVSTAAVLTMLGLLAAGGEGMRSYFTAALAVAPLWRPFEGNYSIASVMQHLLGGSTSVRPAIEAPGLAAPLSMLVSGGVLLLAALAIARTDDLDVGFAAAIAAMLVAGPYTWQHYLVLMVWPLFVLGRRLRARHWPEARTAVFLVSICLMSVPFLFVGYVAIAIAQLGGAGIDGRVAPIARLPLLAIPAGPALVFALLATEPSRAAQPQEVPEAPALVSAGGTT
jgi:hypothetical protein